jgi:hypothetical protein
MIAIFESLLAITTFRVTAVRELSSAVRLNWARHPFERVETIICLQARVAGLAMKQQNRVLKTTGVEKCASGQFLYALVQEICGPWL